MDIPITKKKFTKSKIIIAGGLFALIIFIMFMVSAFRGNSGFYSARGMARWMGCRSALLAAHFTV